MNIFPYFLAHLHPALILLGCGLDVPPIFLVGLALQFGGSRLFSDSLSRLNLHVPAPSGRFVVATYAFLHIAAVAAAVHWFARQPGWSGEAVALVLYVGLFLGGAAITSSHELFHKLHAGERALGLAVLASCSNMHFRIEHVYGHHVRVGTPEDHATARRGQSIYQFLPAALLWGWLSPWGLETRRLRNRGFIHRWLAHRMIHYTFIQGAIYAGIFYFCGPGSVLFFASTSFLTLLLGESSNYIEHYGLVRKKLPSGRYEAVGLQHSWDTDDLLTNWSLFNIGRHAEHHLKPLKPFNDLDFTPVSAQRVPFSYARLLLLAYQPSKWMKEMDARL